LLVALVLARFFSLLLRQVSWETKAEGRKYFFFVKENNIESGNIKSGKYEGNVNKSKGRTLFIVHV